MCAVFSSPPRAVTGMPLTQQQADTAGGAGHPASWGTLVCRSHYNPSILHPECRQQLLLPHASHKRYKVCVHCPLDELFAPSGWERDVWPHPEAANCLRGATRKSPHYSKVLSFSLQILVIALYLK